VSHPSCIRSIVGRTAYEPWSMSIVDDGSPTPTFWSFVLGRDNLSPVEQQRHWLEDTVCLELIIHKDGSIVSLSKISEMITSKCSSLILWNLQLYNNSLNESMWHFQGGGVKTYSDPSYIFSRGQDLATPRIGLEMFAPCVWLHFS